MDTRIADSGRAEARPIFVIGTGRSGTHCIAGVVAQHPDVRATVEEQPMFDWSVAMAMNPACEPRLFDTLVAEYTAQLARSAPRRYLDKSHPNIWIAERLLVAFPQARFIGVQRHPYSTVASMQRHGAVSRWHRQWKSFPVPNRFLGITKEWSEVYDSLPMASRCALRWKCHHERMQALRASLGSAIAVIWYEALVDRTERVIRGLEQFLDLPVALTGSEVRRDSLETWTSRLSSTEMAQIQAIVGLSPHEWRDAIMADAAFG